MELQGQILGNQNRKIKTMERNEISNMYQKKQETLKVYETEFN